MEIRLHPHSRDRLRERGATEDEVKATAESGERFAAKYGRTGFRWNGKYYSVKQIEAYAVEENGWTVITVIVKFF